MTGPLSPSPASGATGWPWSGEPLPWIVLALSATAYAAGARAVRRGHGGARALRTWEIGCFAAGWVVSLIAQVSPVDWLSERLFSIHMTQHELLILVAAPLMVLGRPLVIMLWALPDAPRHAVAAAVRARPFAASWRWLSFPLTVWLLHGAALWLWHLPSWYQAALASDTVHLLQHASFFGTALLFWWTLVRGGYGRAGYGAAVLFVFTTMLHSGLLGALFTFSSRLWYPVYAGTTGAWRLEPIEDQQLAGLIMWVPFGVVFLIVALALFAAWMGESDRRLAYSRLAPDSGAEERDA